MFRERGARTTLANVKQAIQSASSSSSSSSSSQQPRRLRLLRLPRAALPDQFYGSFKFGDRGANHALFRLSLRSLSPAVLREVNAGPTWLRGDYPAGLLKKRHERRRTINDRTQHDGWREDVSDIPYATPTQSTLAKRPLLVSAKDDADDDVKPYGRWLPVLVQVSKKGLDKRAVYRNRAKTRLLAGLQRILANHADSLPFHDAHGNVFAYVFTPRPEVIKASIETISSAMDEVLQKVKDLSVQDKRSSDKKVRKKKR